MVAPATSPDLVIGRRPLPIFKPHERTRPDGTSYAVTDDDLLDILQQMLDDLGRGEIVRLTVGHVQPDPQFPEANQPKVIGEWLDPHLGEWDGAPAILATPAVRRESVAEAVGRPYRSAEYYATAKRLTGVALLSRDPALRLGAADLADLLSGAGRPDHYALPGTVDMADELPKVGAEGEDAAKDRGFVPEKTAEAGGVPEGHEQFLAHMAHYVKSNPFMTYAMKCYEASQAAAGGAPAAVAPSATNAAPPAKEEEKPMAAQSPDQAELYALKASLERLRQERADEKKAAARAELAEVYQLSAAQLTVFDALPEGHWQVYQATIRGNCPKKTPPTPADLVEVSQGGRLATPGAERYDVEAGRISEQHEAYALDYLRDHAGCSWDDAVKATTQKAYGLKR